MAQNPALLQKKVELLAKLIADSQPKKSSPPSEASVEDVRNAQKKAAEEISAAASISDLEEVKMPSERLG